MARVIRSKKLDSRTARRSISMGKSTHWVAISRGRALGYRRGWRGGTWVARFDAENLRREEKLGEADDVLDPDGVQVLDYAQALLKAGEFFDSALHEATGEMPRQKSGGPYSVRMAVLDYLKSLESRDAPDYRGAVYDFNRNVIPQLGAVPVVKLRIPKLNSWREQLSARRRLSKKKPAKVPLQPDAENPMTADEKRRRRASTNRSLRRLVAALNYAVATRKANADPKNWKIAAYKNAESARAEYLTETEQRDFAAACVGEPDFQDLVLAALHTGCRLGELARLRVRDFVPASKTIYVEQSKSGKPRHVFLPEEAAEFFRRLILNRASDAVLLVRSNGSSWTKDAVKKPMLRACKIAEIRRLGFHQLRHSFATRLLERSVSMSIVAHQLGHGSLRMLERHYAHLADDHMRGVISALPETGLNQAAKVKRDNVVALPRRQSK